MRELQDKCCLLERGKLSLEKECISLQAALETERREHSQGSETISDLMGGCHAVFNTRLAVCQRYPVIVYRNKQQGIQEPGCWNSFLAIEFLPFGFADLQSLLVF